MSDVRDISENAARLRQQLVDTGATLGGGGDGGGTIDHMEARVAKVEAGMEYVQRDVGEIKTDLKEIRKDMRVDFRLLFGAIIVVALGLAGLMARGFHWL